MTDVLSDIEKRGSDHHPAFRPMLRQPIAKGDAEIAGLAVTGSLRELLLGASAPSQSAIQKIIGIPHNRAMLLMEQLGQS
jgi:hypothetical protein